VVRYILLLIAEGDDIHLILRRLCVLRVPYIHLNPLHAQMESNPLPPFFLRTSCPGRHEKFRVPVVIMGCDSNEPHGYR
jgi:hypothetical protein